MAIQLQGSYECLGICSSTTKLQALRYWFISFQKSRNAQIPKWFWINWWSLDGPPSSLSPESLSSHYKIFASNETTRFLKFHSALLSEPPFIYMLYSHTYGIPSIQKWDYKKILPRSSLPVPKNLCEMLGKVRCSASSSKSVFAYYL